MNQQLEKLIDLALADGVITDKERAILQRKAQQLGLDQDEFEMVLEGKLHQLEAGKLKQKEKVGNIKTCPACGASVKAMELTCSECGHEFTNVKANSTLIKLLDEIEKINNKDLSAAYSSKGLNGQRIKELNIDKKRGELKCELIENFPIPNTREDILEFLSYSISKGKDISYTSFLEGRVTTSDSWRKKAEEILMKSKIMFKSDPEFYNTLLIHEADLRSSNKIRNRIQSLVIVGFVIFMIVLIGGILLQDILKK